MNKFQFICIGMMISCSMISGIARAQEKTGVASYYHNSLEGNHTANGEIFHQDKFTAAHKSLPFDTWVLIRDRKGLEVVVRINDRLPARSSRMIDLTMLAARQLDMITAGIKQVRLNVISAREAWLWFLEKGYLGVVYNFFPD